MAENRVGQVRVAYLSSMYPCLSHTFIEREVRALRERGAEIVTFSIRPTGGNDTLGEAHQDAASETFCILGQPLRFALGQCFGLARNPTGYLRAVLGGQRLAFGFRSRFRHLCYAMEAVVLAQELKRQQLRHVHVHFAHNGATVGMLACRFDRSLEFSLSVHGSLEFFNVEKYRLTQKIQAAAFVRCISRFCRGQVLIHAALEKWPHCHVVHCGINPEMFPPKSHDPTEPLRIITVGRLHPIKALPLLLQACRALIDESVRCTLDIVGDGEQREKLQAEVSRLGLEQVVTFHGPTAPEALSALYDSANVMVVCSFMEGLPVVLMEAMAKQLPVISTWVAGVPELVKHGENGLLIPTGDLESLTAALRTLAFDVELRRQLGHAGRAAILQHFTADQTADAMIGLFQSTTTAIAFDAGVDRPQDGRLVRRRRTIAPELRRKAA